MNLLLAADEEKVRYALFDNGRLVEEGAERSLECFKDQLVELNQKYDVHKIGYRVLNTGNSVANSVVERTASLAARIGDEPVPGRTNDLAMKELLTFSWERFVSAQHFVLSESAFYLGLPQHSRLYAIPLEYADNGIMRHGRHGLAHEWALGKLGLAQSQKPARVVSVYLNGSTDVVAIKDGKPVMTSDGFSGLDGLMSDTGCGLIDTSIVFRMFSVGFSAERIHRVLAEESGFKALVKGGVTLGDLLLGDDPKVREAGKIYSYQLIKAIGACLGVLNGADAIVFISVSDNKIREWVLGFLEQMAFLGIAQSDSVPEEGRSALTVPGSAVAVHYLACDQWRLMQELLTGYV